MASLVLRYNNVKNRVGYLLHTDMDIITFDFVTLTPDENPFYEVTAKSIDHCDHLDIPVHQINAPHNPIVTNAITEYLSDDSVILMESDTGASYFLEQLLERNPMQTYYPNKKLPNPVTIQSDMSYKDNSVSYGYVTLSDKELFSGQTNLVQTEYTNKVELEKAAATRAVLQIPDTYTGKVQLELDNKQAASTFKIPQTVENTIEISHINRGENKYADALAKATLHTEQQITL